MGPPCLPTLLCAQRGPSIVRQAPGHHRVARCCCCRRRQRRRAGGEPAEAWGLRHAAKCRAGGRGLRHLRWRMPVRRWRRRRAAWGGQCWLICKAQRRHQLRRPGLGGPGSSAGAARLAAATPRRPGGRGARPGCASSHGQRGAHVVEEVVQLPRCGRGACARRRRSVCGRAGSAPRRSVSWRGGKRGTVNAHPPKTCPASLPGRGSMARRACRRATSASAAPASQATRASISGRDSTRPCLCFCCQQRTLAKVQTARPTRLGGPGQQAPGV